MWFLLQEPGTTRNHPGSWFLPGSLRHLPGGSEPPWFLFPPFLVPGSGSVVPSLQSPHGEPVLVKGTNMVPGSWFLVPHTLGQMVPKRNQNHYEHWFLVVPVPKGTSGSSEQLLCLLARLRLRSHQNSAIWRFSPPPPSRTHPNCPNRHPATDRRSQPQGRAVVLAAARATPLVDWLD